MRCKIWAQPAKLPLWKSDCLGCAVLHCLVVNPRRACAARVTVVVLSFCLSVCLSVCLLPRFLPLRATRPPISDTNGFSATPALF